MVENGEKCRTFDQTLPNIRPKTLPNTSSTIAFSMREDVAATKALLRRLHSLAPLLCLRRLSPRNGAGPRCGSSLHNRLFHARKYSAVWKRLADDTRRRGVVQECYSMDFVVRSSEVAVAVAVAEMETETRYAGSLHLPCRRWRRRRH